MNKTELKKKPDTDTVTHIRKIMKIFKSENDNVANNLLRYIVHSHKKGVLYFQITV
jgi:hypothetical protein